MDQGLKGGAHVHIVASCTQMNNQNEDIDFFIQRKIHIYVVLTQLGLSVSNTPGGV
jgi:hypothetical protein